MSTNIKYFQPFKLVIGIIVGSYGQFLLHTWITIFIPHFNTSLNKFWAWHINGATNKKNPYDFYKVLTFKWHVKIWAQSDYRFTN